MFKMRRREHLENLGCLMWEPVVTVSDLSAADGGKLAQWIYAN